MIDMLFVEIGAVVTEVLGPSRCTIQPYCSVGVPPSYGPEGRIAVDFTHSLSHVLDHRGSQPVGVAVQQGLYDRIKGHGSPPIGAEWPGGVYEGILGIRTDVVNASSTLAAAVASLPGKPWEYQVVVSIDEVTGAVRRYHGFFAEIVKEEGAGLLLQVADAGTSATPGTLTTNTREVPYDPADTRTFYTGALVADRVVKGGQAPRSPGAVFISTDAVDGFSVSLPKLPPGAG